MAKITYTDLDGTAPQTNWMGQSFEHGKSVTTDNKALIDAAKMNPWFEVTGAAESAEADTPFNRGAEAARDDKKRSVPPAYRGKTEADEWLRGFDSIRPPDPGTV